MSHSSPTLAVWHIKVNGAYSKQSVFKGYISCFVSTKIFHHHSRNRYFLTVTKPAQIKYCHLEEFNPLQHSSSTFLPFLAQFCQKKKIFSAILHTSGRVWKFKYGIMSSTTYLSSLPLPQEYYLANLHRVYYLWEHKDSACDSLFVYLFLVHVFKFNYIDYYCDYNHHHQHPSTGLYPLSFD